MTTTKPSLFHLQAKTEPKGLIHYAAPPFYSDTLCGIRQPHGYWFDVGGRSKVTCPECQRVAKVKP